jgi:uncharacterized membrane protein YphA (DoxX/SURF4 family)
MTVITSSTGTSIGRGRLDALTPYALWAAQGALALIFLFAGVVKFVMPLDVMQRDIGLPAWFLYFVGIAEVSGALGLVLPGILNVGRLLTPLAAAGLVVIMVGATAGTLAVMGPLAAALPFVVGALALFVLRGRWNWLPA